MSIIPFPNARSHHPARGRSVLTAPTGFITYIEDASAYGVTTRPHDMPSIARSVARQHLFRLGFGEAPSPRRVKTTAPIVAHRDGETIGVVLTSSWEEKCADFNASDIERALSAARSESRDGDAVSAGVMSIRFFGDEELRVEITVAGSKSLSGAPVVPFD